MNCDCYKVAVQALDALEELDNEWNQDSSTYYRLDSVQLAMNNLRKIIDSHELNIVRNCEKI
jgi:hypothetical protein